MYYIHGQSIQAEELKAIQTNQAVKAWDIASRSELHQKETEEQEVGTETNHIAYLDIHQKIWFDEKSRSNLERWCLSVFPTCDFEETLAD